MVDPAAGPLLFDTSAESWLERTREANVLDWLRRYLEHHPLQVSAITVVERIRGYALIWHRAAPERRPGIEAARLAYLQLGAGVWPLNVAVAVVSGEIMALVPEPPTPPKRVHRYVESRQERLSRWRFDGMIAATALVAGLPLVHNNAADFETIRSAIERSPERFPGLGSLDLLRCTSLA
jgi:predicted nucleic acid-binding protein